MNISLTNIGTDSYQKGGSVFAGNLPVLQNNVLSKSAQDKAERQQKTQSEISFWEKQKENLKNQECESVEEIAQKLKALHSYEDEIAAAKQSFNNEQMWHILDEAEELGEKIAEAAEKTEPKTAEERREDMAEEALGTDEDEGMMEDVSDLAEEVEAVEENAKELEELAEETQEMQEAKEAQEKLAEDTKQMEEQKQEMEEQQLAARLKARNMEAYQASGKRHPYQALDLLV